MFLGQQELGLNVLEAPGAGFQPAVVATTRRLITADRACVARIVRGYVETIHFFKTRRAETVPVLQRLLGFKNVAAVEAAYDFYAPLFQPAPRPSLPGIQKLLDELALTQSAARAPAPSAILNTSFLDELEQSGFITKLYG